MSIRILTIGYAEYGVIMNMDEVPASGQTVSGKDYRYTPGGRGGIAAVTMKKLGADSIFCARLGNDENSERLLGYYDDLGIDTRYITRDRNVPTGFSVVMNDFRGGVHTVEYKGANVNFGREELEGAFMTYPDALFLQFELPDREIVASTRFAKRQDIPVFVDAGPNRLNFPLEMLENVEIFTLDDEEMAYYTGIFPSDPDKCLRSAAALASKVNSKYIVLKLGSKGSFVYDGTYYYVVPSYDTTFIDKGGAGDVFSASLSYEYLRHKDIEKACKFANLAAALTVSKNGTYSSIPSRVEIEDFANRLGVSLY